MKYAILLSIASLYFVTWTYASAGNESHGGGGLACKDKNTGVTTTELLDLYEAEHPEYLKFYKRGQAPAPLPIIANTKYNLLDPLQNDAILSMRDEILKNALGRLYSLNPYFAKRVEDAWRALPIMDIKQEAKDYPANAVPTLPPPSDTALSVIPEDCNLVGIGDYIDAINRLRVDQDIISHALQPRDQAAFYLHEAVYKVVRDQYREYAVNQNGMNSATPVLPSLNLDVGHPLGLLMNGSDSIDSRKLIAYLFSDSNFTGRRADVPGGWVSFAFDDTFGSAAALNDFCLSNISTFESKMKAIVDTNKGLKFSQRYSLLDWASSMAPNACSFFIRNALGDIELNHMALSLPGVRRSECLSQIDTLLKKPEVLLVSDLKIFEAGHQTGHHSECSIGYITWKNAR